MRRIARLCWHFSGSCDRMKVARREATRRGLPAGLGFGLLRTSIGGILIVLELSILCR